MTWQDIGTAPETSPSNPIMRWHTVWGSVVTVFANAKPDGGKRMDGASDWIVKDLSISWPEAAFSPHWAPLPEPPQ